MTHEREGQCQEAVFQLVISIILNKVQRVESWTIVLAGIKTSKLPTYIKILSDQHSLRAAEDWRMIRPAYKRQNVVIVPRDTRFSSRAKKTVWVIHNSRQHKPHGEVNNILRYQLSSASSPLSFVFLYLFYFYRIRPPEIPECVLVGGGN